MNDWTKKVRVCCSVGQIPKNLHNGRVDLTRSYLNEWNENKGRVQGTAEWEDGTS